jgi:hypothetical protein
VDNGPVDNGPADAGGTDSGPVDTGPRGRALAWAAHLRGVRSSLREDLGAGTTDLGAVLGRRGDPAVGAVHLLWVLESLPGARQVPTRRALAAMGIGERTPLAGLSDAEVAAVLERFGPRGAGSTP